MPRSIDAKCLSALGTVQLLDVRRAAAYAASPDMLPGARWEDPEKITTWTKCLNRDSPVVVYCVHGQLVSQGCATELESAGYDAYFLEGGIEHWKEGNDT